LAALAGLTLLAGAFGKGPMKFLGNMMKKGGTKVAGAFCRKAATEVAETGVKKFSQKQILRGFAGKEAKDAALSYIWESMDDNEDTELSEEEFLSTYSFDDHTNGTIGYGEPRYEIEKVQ
jgi:hypothetical protein